MFLACASPLLTFLPTKITPIMMQASPIQFSAVSASPSSRVAVIEVYRGYVEKMEALADMPAVFIPLK